VLGLVCVSQALVVRFLQIIVRTFVLCLSVMVLSVIPRFAASEHPFGIFNIFLLFSCFIKTLVHLPYA
jgi:hypothetical protein